MSRTIFGFMTASLRAYLFDLDALTRSPDERTVAELGRLELPRVLTALNALLEEHQPDENGRCAACRPRRFSRTTGPCRAYLTAHLCLVAENMPDDTPPLVTARHAGGPDDGARPHRRTPRRTKVRLTDLPA